MLGEVCDVSTVGALLVAAFTAIYIARQWKTRQKILRLGCYAPRVPSYLPLGITTVPGSGLDILIRTIRNALNNESLKTWRDWHSIAPNHGTVEANVLFERCLFTADPHNIKAVLATQFEDFGKGQLFHDTWKQLLGDGIFSTDGAQWQASRHLVRPLFVKDRVSDLDVLERHFQCLRRIITPGDGQDGQKVDISDLIFRCTLDVATDFLLGESIRSLENPAQDFEKAFSHAQNIQMMIARAGHAHVLIPRRSFNKSIESIDAFIQPYIDRALGLQGSMKISERSEPDYTFLHALAHYTRDPKLIRDQLVNILIAGRDTTASALSWVLFELSKHPLVVMKLRKEILGCVNSDRPTYSQLKDMKYLQVDVIQGTE
ncbi:hypothetical protein ASPWEDRAFT_54809 [Aspergillus wentii DTO 134E9]|uniref:Cytochrome P450 n=1 Tax=Aspergillus wentii DTO 134E9 TaxID=1073089 RepID=A0A1L9R5D9_ASPWE|nr:uncharacterized protein ASPWEDRAFT_54809 [Aspergillus wentii DTO 134E9]OJJ30108.1 hypothetical protein ASPWEDRAFT_54809 [Aspergillus wentii DTO 134E9]